MDIRRVVHPLDHRLSARFILFESICKKNVLRALESESSALAISQENSTLTSQNNDLQDANTQYHHSLQSINHLFEDLIELRNDCHQTYEESLEVIKKIIDTLPLSLSSSRGDSKRCAVWLSSPTTNTLDFHTGSFNFPKDYTNSRKLDIDNSTGGRCYRKNEIIDLDDVTEDPDWLKKMKNLEGITKALFAYLS